MLMEGNNTLLLRGNAFYLKSLFPEDVAENYIQWLKNPTINEFLVVRQAPPTLEKQKHYVASFDHRTNFIFGIYVNQQDQLIGSQTLRICPKNKKGVFGYFVGDRQYWGTTAALTSCYLLLEFAFMNLNLYRVEGGALKNNIRSLFNFKKLGFTQESVQREAFLINGSFTDCFYFGILKKEWAMHRTKFLSFGINE